MHWLKQDNLNPMRVARLTGVARGPILSAPRYFAGSEGIREGTWETPPPR
jgi:hypothetical protein